MQDNTFNFEEIASRSGRSIEEVKAIVEQAFAAVTPQSKTFLVKESGKIESLTVTRKGVGILNTDYGQFWEYCFALDDTWGEYLVIWKGEVDDQLNPRINEDTLLIRTDSGCETGQVMGDKTCECREQLHLAMEAIATEQRGMIVHIPKQDGRGMGTPFKLGTLFLQDMLQLNTVESATLLSRGQEFDVRTYAGAIAIMMFFNIANSVKINLATNNPRKTCVFVENGYEITGLKAVIVPATEQTKHHLEAKQKFLGHIDLVRECVG